MKRLAGYFVKWAGFLLLWLLFVHQINVPELSAGSAGSALTVFALEWSRHAEPLHFQPKPRWYLQIWRLPWMILVDLWQLLLSLLRHLQRKPSEALFQITPFHTSGEESHQAAQRCLATVFMSLPPNSVIVDIDINDNVMMFHQVKKSPVPTVVRKLEEQ